jgi:hypothetical protein
MTLQLSGAISFADIQTIFGGTNPIGLNEYYTNDASGFTTGVSGLPSTGSSISLQQFYGKAKGGNGLYNFTSHTFTNAGATGRTGPILTQVRNAYGELWAQNNSYLSMITQGIQLWTVPATGSYTFEVAGAQSGDFNGNPAPGYGRKISGTYSLSKGTILKIIVGQAGLVGSSGYNFGGGGGSFIIDSSTNVLLFAAGGAGGGNRWTGSPGQSGNFATSGGNGTGANFSSGGSNGGPGLGCNGGNNGTGGQGCTGDSKGGGGGGFGNSSAVYLGAVQNTTNGGEGGFGGGGGSASGNSAAGGGGGGGGYSGGGGGGSYASGDGSVGSGGGGGSYGITTITDLGTNTNKNGYISITANFLITEEELYSFTTHTFTNAGATGTHGPILSQIQSAYNTVAWTQNTTYLNMATQGIQLWTVPATGYYKITCAGAKGGGNFVGGPYTGGQGVVISGFFYFTKGSVIKILVGQSGAEYNYTAGGGGGSFVSTINNVPLIVAGGGGGAGNSGGSGYNAVYDKNGGTGTGGHNGGVNGFGSTEANAGGWGQSGAGFFGNGYMQQTSSWGNGVVANAFINNGVGAGISSNANGTLQSCTGTPGGFGGGGSGACNGGGGGGGYSGGGAGGGGGGSYSLVSKTNIGYNNTQGYVTIARDTIFNNSIILAQRHKSALDTLSVDIVSSSSLIFRASRDGWNGSTFHTFCDKNVPIFIVFRSTGNYIATAYTQTAFRSSNDYIYAPPGSVWLNNLENSSGTISTTKFLNTFYPQYTLYDNSSYGPCFGGGYDLGVQSSMTTVSTNKHSYAGTGYSSSILFGSTNATLNEIEVYKIGEGYGLTITTLSNGAFMAEYTKPIAHIDEIPYAFFNSLIGPAFYLKYTIITSTGMQIIVVSCRNSTRISRIAQSCFSFNGSTPSFGTPRRYDWISMDDHDTLFMDGTGTAFISNDGGDDIINLSKFSFTNSTFNFTSGSYNPQGHPGLDYTRAAPVAFPATSYTLYFTSTKYMINGFPSRVWNNTTVTNYLSSWSGTPANKITTVSDGVNSVLVILGTNIITGIYLTFNLTSGEMMSVTSVTFTDTFTFTNGTEQDGAGNQLFAIDGSTSYYKSLNFYYTTRSATSIGSEATVQAFLDGAATANTYFSIGSIDTQTGMDIITAIDTADGYVYFADWGHDNGGLFNFGDDNALGYTKSNIFKIPNNFSGTSPSRNGF